MLISSLISYLITSGTLLQKTKRKLSIDVSNHMSIPCRKSNLTEPTPGMRSPDPSGGLPNSLILH